MQHFLAPSRLRLLPIGAPRPFSVAAAMLAPKDESKADLPVNTLEKYHTAWKQAENGAIYDKKPFKIRLEAGKRYNWCICGKSRTQPMCDGTHRSIYLRIKLRPVTFQVEETKDYWLCNCKQTKHRPFCDGTHKLPHIQQAVK